MTTAILKSLIVHPAAAAIPMLAEQDPASQVIVASIVELGRIIEPLKVSKGRVVDGRIRLRGAHAAGLEVVPVDEVEESEVITIILHSLTARRHYTKSALAYLTFPIMENALTESRKRRLANLKTALSGSKHRSSTQRTIETAHDLAESVGIGRSFFFQAREIRKKFAEYPKVRDEWEPKILSGEMGLGQIQQAISGKISALHGDTNPKGDAAQLLLDLFATSAVRFGRWEKLQPAQRQLAVQKFRKEFLPSLPPELLEQVEQFLEERLAHV